MTTDKATIAFNMPVFHDYVIPEGFLVDDLASHALWYYYLIARGTYETHIMDPIVYEGDKDPEFNFKQVFTSVATAYGVEPEIMVKFWDRVDMQCKQLQLPTLPDEDKYRFNVAAEIVT